MRASRAVRSWATSELSEAWRRQATGANRRSAALPVVVVVLFTNVGRWAPTLTILAFIAPSVTGRARPFAIAIVAGLLTSIPFVMLALPVFYLMIVRAAAAIETPPPAH